MPKKITVTIDEDGKVVTDFQGFTGKACLVEAEKLKAVLASFGITVEDEQLFPKPELNVEVAQTQENRGTVTQEGES